MSDQNLCPRSASVRRSFGIRQRRADDLARHKPERSPLSIDLRSCGTVGVQVLQMAKPKEKLRLQSKATLPLDPRWLPTEWPRFGHGFGFQWNSNVSPLVIRSMSLEIVARRFLHFILCPDFKNVRKIANRQASSERSGPTMRMNPY